jgi:signal transduction histidine kinase
MRSRTVTVGVAVALTLACAVLLVPLAWLTRNAPVRPYQEPIGAAVSAAATALLGLLLSRRQPRNPLGAVLCGIGLAQVIFTFTNEFAIYAVTAGVPGGLPAAWLATWTWVPRIPLFLLLGLLFPDGHHLSPRWRWATVAIACASVVVTLAFAVGTYPVTGVVTLTSDGQLATAPNPALLVGTVGLALTPVAAVATVASLFLRFRRAGAEERLQLKWFFYAFAIFALVGAISTLLPVLGLRQAVSGSLFIEASPLALTGLMAAIAVAILRFRLYEIDVILQKSIVYGGLAAGITLLYAGFVVGAGTLLGNAGRYPLWASIAATLIVAVSFAPARDLLNRWAAQLVFGRRATPYEVLSRFNRWLASSAETASVPGTMARLLAEGTGAERVEVWLLREQGLTPEASWPPSELGTVSATLPPGSSPQSNADLVMPVRHEGAVLGYITLNKPVDERLSPTEQRLVADLSANAGPVFANMRLTSELSRRLDEIRAASGRIVGASDNERRRIERDLHDGAQQRLLGLAMQLKLIQRLAARSGQAALNELLTAALETAGAAIGELRELARGIHPMILEAGLMPALENLAERAAVPVTLTASITRRLPPLVEATAYFVAAEALTNVARHACATSAAMCAEDAGLELIVTVTDNGIGGAEPSRGTGLLGLTDRVSAAGGWLQLSSPVGVGTTLRVGIPCA